MPTRWPSGGLLGSAVDLVRRGGLILPKATFLVATMLEPQQTRSGASAGVGLG